MAISNIRTTLDADIQTVWNVVTSPENYTWRSDLGSIEIIPDKKGFIEKTKDGYSTTFFITDFEPMQRYEFDMENGNMKGHWIGLFSSVNGKTVIDFTEEVYAKKLLLKPFVKGYLKKQQETYIRDLHQYLEKNNG